MDQGTTTTRDASPVLLRAQATLSTTHAQAVLRPLHLRARAATTILGLFHTRPGIQGRSRRHRKHTKEEGLTATWVADSTIAGQKCPRRGRPHIKAGPSTRDRIQETTGGTLLRPRGLLDERTVLSRRNLTDKLASI